MSDFFIPFGLLYIICINLAGFFSMLLDKRKAIHKKWRISERTLFLIALAGGAAGSLVGMYTFHHKTKHWYFKLFMPLIFLAQFIFLFVNFLCSNS